MGGHRLKRQKLNVVKVDGNYNFEFRSPNFDDMPILYLELLENKAKVKAELRNIDYEPAGFDMNKFPNFEQAKYTASEETKRDISENDSNIQIIQNYPISNKPQILTPKKIIIHSDEHHILQENFTNSTVSLSAALSNNPPQPIIQPSKTPVNSSSNNSFQQSNNSSSNNSFQPSNNSFQPSNNSSSNNSFQPSNNSFQPSNNSFQPSNNSFQPSNNSFETNDTKKSGEDDMILNILRGDGSDTVKEVSYDKQTYSPVKQQQKAYPSLSEINAGVAKPGNRDLTFSNKIDEKDTQRKRFLLLKFKTLKRHYVDITIPEFTEFSDLQTMEKEYDMLVTQLRLDANVENYKKYLIVGFGLVEFVLSKFLKFAEIEGFTQQQLLGMNQYEKILLEIGEKHQVDISKQWSPEIRLIGIIAMNAVIFIGTKLLFKSVSGSDVLNMISPPGVKTQENPKSKESTHGDQSQSASKKMKGPDLNLDDL